METCFSSFFSAAPTRPLMTVTPMYDTSRRLLEIECQATATEEVWYL